MSDVTLKLDKDRTLTYLWTDMRTITARLNGITMTELLGKLVHTQPEALHVCLLVGLGNEDDKLTGKKLDQLIQDKWVKLGKPLTDLVNAVLDALEQDGLIASNKKEPAANPTES